MERVFKTAGCTFSLNHCLATSPTFTLFIFVWEVSVLSLAFELIFQGRDHHLCRLVSCFMGLTLDAADFNSPLVHHISTAIYFPLFTSIFRSSTAFLGFHLAFKRRDRQTQSQMVERARDTCFSRAIRLLNIYKMHQYSFWLHYQESECEFSNVCPEAGMAYGRLRFFRLLS